MNRRGFLKGAASVAVAMYLAGKVKPSAEAQQIDTLFSEWESGPMGGPDYEGYHGDHWHGYDGTTLVHTHELMPISNHEHGRLSCLIIDKYVTR